MAGISDYKNLPDKQDLRFAERDAEAIYNVLISQDGKCLDNAIDSSEQALTINPDM